MAGAVSAEVLELVRVPIDPSAPEGGYVEFTRKPLADPPGVFSFSYYFRKAATQRLRNSRNINAKNHPYSVYINGLEAYLATVKRGAPVPGWKIVIFTDRRTLIDIEESMPVEYRVRIKAVLDDPDVILGLVVWPEYDPVARVEGGEYQELGIKVENAILRVFRLFSCVIFSCPSFVRDADTTFAVYSDPKVDDIAIWESEFYAQAMAKGLPFIFATQIEYYKGFHRDPRLPENKSINQLGTFAGVFNYLGTGGRASGGAGGAAGGAEVDIVALWKDALSYIRGVCHIVPETGLSSNAGATSYIGKDEQILVYIWLPQIMDRAFFFYYNFVGGNTSDLMHWSLSRDEVFGKALEKLSTTPGFERAFRPEKVRVGMYGIEKDIIKIQEEQLIWPPYTKLEKFWSSVQVQMISIPTEDEAIESVRSDWLAKGWIDEGDPIADKRFHIPGKDTLHNPYSVIEAFRNPKYDTMLRVITESFQKSHRIICRLEGVPTKYVLEGRYVEENAEYRALEEKRRAKIAAARAEEDYWMTFGRAAAAGPPPRVAAAGPPPRVAAAGAAGGQGPPAPLWPAPAPARANQIQGLGLLSFGGAKKKKTRRGTKKHRRRTHRRRVG
jgi:hypothetical protein